MALNDDDPAPGNPFDDADTTDAPGGAVVYGDDADILAGLDKIDDDDAKAKGKKTSKPAKTKAKDDEDEDAGDKKKPKPKAKPKDDEDEDEGDEDDDQDDDSDDEQEDDDQDDDASDDDESDESSDDDQGEDDDEGEDEGKRDDDLPSKELEKLHREKKRRDEDHRRRDGELRQREAALETERTTFAKERDTLLRSKQEIEALSARVKTSPQAAIALLRKLGMTKEAFKVTDADWHRWWAEDPGAATEVDSLRRDLDETKQRLEKQEAEAKAKAEAQKERQAVIRYVEETAKAVSPERHPLLAAMLKNDRKNGTQVAKSRLYAVADELARRNGRAPERKEVVAEAERRCREDAKRMGFKVATKKNDPHADEKRTAKSKTSQKSTSGRASERANEDDEDDDKVLRRELDELDARSNAKKKSSRR